MKTKPLCFSRKNYTGYYILLSTASLLLGGIIYLLFRPLKVLFFNWIRAVGLESQLNLVRLKSLPISRYLPDWVVYSLPNGLWAFAYALLITVIWSGSKSWLRYFWMASIPVLVLGYEFLQYARIIPGTFCVQDIIVGLAGLIIGILVGLKTIKPQNHEKASE